LVLVSPDDVQYVELSTACGLPLTAQDPFSVAALSIAVKENTHNAGGQFYVGFNDNTRIVGGQLYPPIHAFLYVPLALLDPPDAYRVAVVLPAALAFLAGWGLTKVTRGGIWWPVGTLLTLIFPHFHDAQTLGHN